MSSLHPSSVVVQPGLCRTWSETPKTGFLTTRLNSFQDAFFSVTAFLLVSPVTGFLLDNDCHVASQCDCRVSSTMGTYYIGVMCENKHLTEFPKFKNVSFRMSENWTINLRFNSISYIPENAFTSLQTFGNGYNVNVLLEENDLWNISDSAFSGIEHLVVELALDQNHLTFIPPVVAKLNHLQALSLQYNPIAHLDFPILISVQRTLKQFTISVDKFRVWPTSLKYLKTLERLRVAFGTRGRGPSIPVDAFDGMNETLQRLSIYNADLMEFPAAVCNLRRLEVLEFDHNDVFHLSGRNVINCTSPLNSTKHIYIFRAMYDQFPNIFDSFPNIETIDFEQIDIRFIDDSLFPNAPAVKHFKCETCKLQTVPGAINLLTLMEDCILADNLITTVERHSFDNLRYLGAIYLYSNPIVYISKFAFRNLVALRVLHLYDTKITVIPEAVQTLHGLTSLRMGPDITCTCGQSWMKQWVSSTSVTVYGGCHGSNETLNHFLSNSLRNC